MPWWIALGIVITFIVIVLAVWVIRRERERHKACTIPTSRWQDIWMFLKYLMR